MNAVVVRSFAAMGFWLSFALLVSASTASAVDLSVLGIEVTQALQHYDLSDPQNPANNSNTLVAGAATTARVFVRVENSLEPVPGVTARFIVKANGVELPYFAPFPPVSITAPVNPDREIEHHSLNYTLPFTIQVDDSVELIVELDPWDTIAEENEHNNRYVMKNIDFACRNTPTIAYVPIDYSASDETDPSTLGVPDNNLIRRFNGDDFVFGIYPFPDDRSRYSGFPFALSWPTNIDAPNGAVNLILALEELRSSQEPIPPDYLYGWFRGNPYAGNGAAWTNNFVAFGNTDPSRHQRTFAHEMGHLFGLGHNSRDIAPDVGWDVLNLLGLGRVMPGDKLDIMFPGQQTPQAWVDDITYEYFLASDILDCGTDREPRSTEAPFVTAVASLEPGRGELRHAFAHRRYATATASDPEGTVGVRAVDGAGRVLEEVRLNPSFESETEEPMDFAPVAVTFSDRLDMSRVAALQLVEGALVSDVMTRSANAPEVAIASPRPGQTLDGEFQIVWEARDRDGDALTFLVQYSPGFDDQGRARWLPLAARAQGHRLQVDARDFPGSSNARIRVVASDGLNSSQAEVSGLYFAVNQEPEVAIVDKRPTMKLSEGSVLILRAVADDAEDIQLADQALSWTSSLDGPIGSGAVLETRALSAGVHQITVAVTDSSGAQSQDSVEIEVASTSFTTVE